MALLQKDEHFTRRFETGLYLVYSLLHFQLQDVLENKIASLVSTLKSADSAEKEFLKNKALEKNTKDDAMLEALNSVAHNLKEMKMNVCCNVSELFTTVLFKNTKCWHLKG